MQILSPRPPISFPVGTNVTFQCEATGFVFARWKVNATQLAGQLTRGAFANRGIITEPPPMLQEIGNISYTLYALASFENNRTVITCRASMNLTSPYVSSDGVTLLVFGECFYKMSCSNLTSHKSPFPDFSGRAGDEAKPHHLPFRSKFLLHVLSQGKPTVLASLVSWGPLEGSKGFMVFKFMWVIMVCKLKVHRFWLCFISFEKLV